MFWKQEALYKNLEDDWMSVTFKAGHLDFLLPAERAQGFLCKAWDDTRHVTTP